MMLPSSRLFRSRWKALAWAGGILWLAYDVSGTAPARRDGNAATSADATGEAVTANDLAVIADAMGS